MDSNTAAKFSVILTLTFLLYGLTAFVNSAEPVDPNCPCTLTIAEMQSAKLYDLCTGSGTFKSKSACYKTNDNPPQQKAPYQFYTCAANGGSYLLYPRKCPGPLIVVNGTDLAPVQNTTFFNAYNPSSGQCDQKPDPAYVVERTEPPGTTAWSVDC